MFPLFTLLQFPFSDSSEALLARIQTTADPSEARRLAERLLNETEPRLAGILRRRGIRDPDTAADLLADVRHSLLARILPTGPSNDLEPIRDWDGFTARTVHRACNGELRRTRPARAALRASLYDMLSGRTSQSGFAVWSTGKRHQLAGFAGWRDRREAHSWRRARFLEQPRRVASEAFPHLLGPHANPAEVVAEILRWLGGPVPLDDLVHICADLWDVREHEREESPEPGYEDPAERAPSRAALPDERAERREYLRVLWLEVRALPLHQRRALLLKFTDPRGRGLLALLPMEGIASLSTLAEALELSWETFAQLWPELPLSDLRIAELLGCERQTVINYRKSGRERLERRMAAWERRA